MFWPDEPDDSDPEYVPASALWNSLRTYRPRLKSYLTRLLGAFRRLL